MRKLVFSGMLVLLLVSLASLVYADTDFFLGGNIGDLGQLGYKKPAIALEVYTETETKHFLWANDFSYSPTDKIAYGNVDQIALGSTFLAKLGRSHAILVGNRLGYGKIWFHDLGLGRGLSFQTYGYQIVGGWQSDGGLRILATISLPGHDTRYHTQGAAVKVSQDFRHFRIGYNFGYEYFYPNTDPGHKFHAIYVEASAAVRF